MLALALFACLSRPLRARDAGRGRPRPCRHACDLPRRPQRARDADERLHRHRQVPAARRADVRARRRDLRPLRRGAAPRQFHPGADRPQSRLARRRHGDRLDVPRRHLGLRTRERRGGRRRHDGGAVAGRLSARFLGERHRRRGRDRHPDPALDRAHHLQRIGAAGLGAGALCRRHDPRHPGRHRASRPDLLDVEEARFRPRREGFPAPAAVGKLQGGDLGAPRPGADPRRHAGRLVHADRGRRDGGRLRPLRRLRDLPLAESHATSTRCSSRRRRSRASS